MAELDVAYLFLDAIRAGMRMGGAGKEAVMVAYAILQDGSTELLAVDLGQGESDRSWGNFFDGLKSRGLRDPLLICFDGNAGVMNAIDSHFTTRFRKEFPAAVSRRKADLDQCLSFYLFPAHH